MSGDLLTIADAILERTSGGLDIIFELYPNANTKKNFKLRDERTPSASLKKLSDGNWVVTDFGGDSKPKNAIMLFAEENGFEYSKAVFVLAQRYGIPTSDSQNELKSDFKTYPIHDYPHELNEDGFWVETSEKIPERALKTLGPFVTEDTCKKCNCYYVKYYAFKNEKDGKERIIQISSTEDYPIFAFINKHENKSFYKIYQPLNKDKGYRFVYLGGRPSNFINGLERLKKTYSKNTAKFHEEISDETKKEVPSEPDKISTVLICSGERDALNATSLGYFAIWHNSETGKWTPDIMKRIFQMVEDVVNIPDLDATGVKQGRELANQYLTMKTLWLPSWLRKVKDWRGNPRKDFTDFCERKKSDGKEHLSNTLKKMIENAYPLQFWMIKHTLKGTRYEISNTLLYNFLQQNGFYRFNEPGSKRGFKFIKINNHIVEEVEVENVYAFLKKFMFERNTPLPLKDTVINTTKISEQKLSWLDMVDLSFKNFDEHNQIFHFSDKTWIINKNGISESSDIKDYTWIDEILDVKASEEREKALNPKSFKIENDYFSIWKTGEDEYDIEIREKNCEFLNFLINTSRVHWKKEFIHSWITENDEWRDAYKLEENEKYRLENKSVIDGERLSDEEIKDQKRHLINKIFAFGYLLHGYKNPAKAWAVYCLENDVVDDEDSKGGTGKSLYSLALSHIIRTKMIAARKSDLMNDPFVYDGITAQTRLVLFDDSDRNFDFGKIYSEVTGPWQVNPKFGTRFTLPFSVSPKVILSSNFSLREQSSSSHRRILFVGFSDYFHVKTDELPGNTPEQTFGHAMFNSWSDQEWNRFFNFAAQCIRFYLSCEERINPPMDSLNQRNLIASIGQTFIDWADEFFASLTPDNHGVVEFEKIATIDNIKSEKKMLSNITSNKFVSKLKDYCRLMGYTYMPGNKRIQRTSRIDATKVVDWLAVGMPKDENENNDNNITQEEFIF
ncbi:hypothetical protein [Ornithobacterium rhinotracheale]|uniref:hypothetical protein n=1 Tax=Ornithobacterium rhinotracheale TaxID=28251 RepID=UPI001FF2445E|nr:hypothetical protein [Ornithobacterium rhinotracheale]MCK0201318.1 hypothetical protein [Ornithobacterium rhinotracheale]